MMWFNRRGVCAWRVFALGTVLAATGAFAQPKWVALDDAKPGTPAEIRFDSRASTANLSVGSVLVHGFWSEAKKGPDGAYTKISVPGLGSVEEPGAPELPVARMKLAIVTGAKEARLRTSKPGITKSFPGLNVWPRSIAEMDDGKPEVFRRDDAIYKLDVDYPQIDGRGTHPTRAKLGAIQGVTVEVHPFKWNPAKKLLTVQLETHFQFDHAGTPVRNKAITKQRLAVAEKAFLNWSEISIYYPGNLFYYEGDFLFVYPTGYKEELQPLIDQKKARGFVTAERVINATGNTCSSIRTLIQSWYNGRPVWTDKYAIIVGDVSVIPLCTAPTGVPTDDLYASTDGDDLDEEIYLGRLSVDSETDALNQVTKILTYEDNPALFCCYDEALLVAHKEGAPGKYVGAHESVRTASYATPPTFTTLYGNVAGVDDADVSSQVNSGLGLVAYRGHGSATAWTGWNLTNDYYDTGNVMGLTNASQQVPVIWSFACNNNELGVGDSIGEVWMEDVNNRAVSHYGATVPSYTSENHELDRQMFKAVYDLGLTTQSHAIEYAEEQMANIIGSSNAWMYLLLGDPEMQIRRRSPLDFDFTVILPELYKKCYGPGCFLEISVLNKHKLPMPGVKVSIYKASDGVGVVRDEILNNRYTDAAGKVRIPASTATLGTILYSVQDAVGNVKTGKIAVR